MQIYYSSFNFPKESMVNRLRAVLTNKIKPLDTLYGKKMCRMQTSTFHKHSQNHWDNHKKEKHILPVKVCHSSVAFY